MSARDELRALIATNGAVGLADEILALGYRKPRIVTTAEELDALRAGSVVLSDPYRQHSHGWPVAFQRWDDGAWHRGARGSDTHPDYILPATVLYEPEPQP